jgi:hypothetical protein
LKAIEKETFASPESADLSDRSGFAFDGDKRARLGVVGCNVEVAVDTQHHLIVTHEVTKHRFGSSAAC